MILLTTRRTLKGFEGALEVPKIMEDSAFEDVASIEGIFVGSSNG